MQSLLNSRVRLDGSSNCISVSSMFLYRFLIGNNCHADVMWLQIDGTWTFWYQLREALNWGSLLNSFAFRRGINPLTAIPTRNKVRTLLNDQKDKNLMMWWICFDACEIWPVRIFHTQCCHMILLTFTLQSADWFISWSCFCCLTENLPWLLCSVNHSSILWSSSGYFGVKHPIVFRFADNLISPLKRFAWSFLQRRTMDSLMPYSLVISELFSTASASVTVVSFKCKVVWRDEPWAWWHLTWNKRLRTWDCLVDTTDV